MTIIQIAPSQDGLFGLGNDGLLYKWNPSTKKWMEA